MVGNGVASVRRIGVVGKQRRGRHQLPRLAIPTLGYLLVDPGLLQGMQLIFTGRQTFYGGDLLALNRR